MNGRRMLLVLALWLSAAPALAEAPPPAVDPEIRAGIDAVVDAVVREDEAVMDRIRRLRDATEGRRDILLVQVALYLAESDSTEESMGGALLFHHLKFSSGEKLDALLPHLESANPALAHVAADLMSTIDRPDGGDPDFSFYEERMRPYGDAPPPALVRYLYGVSPMAARESMSRLHARGSPPPSATASAIATLADLGPGRAAPYSEAEVDRARRALETLSRDGAWWVRACAAAVAARTPELATADVLDRLRTDPHPLVRTLTP